MRRLPVRTGGSYPLQAPSVRNGAPMAPDMSICPLILKQRLDIGGLLEQSKSGRRRQWFYHWNIHVPSPP